MEFGTAMAEDELTAEDIEIEQLKDALELLLSRILDIMGVPDDD